MSEAANPGPPRADDGPARELTRPVPLLDHGFYGILAGNAMTLAAALTQHWSAAPVLWIYWGQSVVIGIVNVIRILSLRDFSVDGLTMNGRPVTDDDAGKHAIAAFFVVHYGMFHLGYAIFLAHRAAAGPWPDLGALAVLVNVAAFALAHGVPLALAHGRDEAQARPNLGTLLFYPYLRILPMHLTIIFESMLAVGELPLFIGLKTVADLGMHLVERRLFRAPA